MTFKVRATQRGFYNQQIMEPGQVFELLCYDDGSFPLRMEFCELKDAAGNSFEPKRYDRSRKEQWKDPATGEPMHAHFAPDTGEVEGAGHFAGEVFRYGWMQRVPDSIPVGLYALEQNFGPTGPEPIAPQIQRQPALIVTREQTSLGRPPQAAAAAPESKPRRTGS